MNLKSWILNASFLKTIIYWNNESVREFEQCVQNIVL